MADEQRQTAFLAAVIWHPLIKVRNAGGASEILVPLGLYLGVNKDAVTVQVAKQLTADATVPETGEVEIIIHPFPA